MRGRWGALGAWSLYLVLVVVLAPVLVPSAAGRLAIVDPLNGLAMAAFAISVVISRRPVRLPFLGPVLVIALCSVLATFNAANPGAALFTLIQDAYLYVCFAMLVNVLSERGDQRGMRVAWLLTACAVSAIGIAQVAMHGSGSPLDVVRPTGFRAVGTFDQPDDFADYLVMSVFLVLSLNEEIGRVARWSAIALIGVGIAATKANGAVLSLAGGLMAWALVRAWTKRASYTGLVAGALFALSLGLVAVWLIVGVGVGSAQIKELESKSFLGRMSHSSEGRAQIWATLWHRYLRNPVGLGPGNSRWQVLRVEERERPLVGPTQTFDTGADPFLSKEAHNDYVSYLVERGPIALLFMLVFKFQIFGQITRWWKRRAGDGRFPARGGALAAAAFGAWVASWINANTIETLHFRHVWIFLAMVCALGSATEAQLGVGPGDRARTIAAPTGARAIAAA